MLPTQLRSAIIDHQRAALSCAVLCGAVRCFAVYCGALLCSVVRCRAARYCAARCCALPCCAVLRAALHIIFRRIIIQQYQGTPHQVCTYYVDEFRSTPISGQVYLHSEQRSAVRPLLTLRWGAVTCCAGLSFEQTAATGIMRSTTDTRYIPVY